MRARMRLKRPLAVLASGLLGASAALVASCGGGSGKLIPVANSEPLQKDFQEVATAAESSRGSCAGTEAALLKAQQDFNNLPATVDAGLRRRLGDGLSKLRTDALELCSQPGTTGTSATATTPTQTATTPTTPTTPTTSTETTPTTPTTSTTPGGATSPSKEGEAESPKHKAGGTEPEAGGGPPNGGQEGGK
jgi:hypothetical protein